MFRIENDILKIDDNYKTNIWFVIFIAIINICNVIILFATKSIDEFNTFNYITLAIGVILLISLIWFLKKKSFKKEIPLKEINKLHASSVMCAKRYSLLLNNGKRRDLPIKKDDVSKLSELLESVDIKTF